MLEDISKLYIKKHNHQRNPWSMQFAENLPSVNIKMKNYLENTFSFKVVRKQKYNFKI